VTSDDSIYAPNHRPAVRQPKGGEPLWSLRKEDVTWTCELRFHGESYGWEAQILRDGDLVIGRRFELKEWAIKWAEQEKSDLHLGE